MKYKKLKFLGRGFEFCVYQYDKNRVIKTPTSPIQIFRKLLVWEPKLLLSPKKLFWRLSQIKQMRWKSIEVIKRSNIDKKYFGNFKHHKDYIIQDRGEILKYYLNQDKNSSKKYIKKYINLLFKLWEYGISDNVFNITINNIVNKNGEVIFCDLGEILTEKEKVKELIKKKKWLKQYSYRFHMNRETKQIFKEEMDRYITIENLEKYWRSRV